VRARALTKHGSQQVYNTIPKFKEEFVMNCVINVARGFLPTFYIFKGEKLRKD
jgi:hypothetical protein